MKAAGFLAFALLSIFTVAPAQAGRPVVETVNVDLVLKLDGQPVLSPSATLKIGKEATVTTESSSADGRHWQIRLLAGKPYLLKEQRTAVPLRIGLFEIVQGDPVLRAQPHLDVVPGEAASINLPFASAAAKRRSATVEVKVSSPETAMPPARQAFASPAT